MTLVVDDDDDGDGDAEVDDEQTKWISVPVNLLTHSRAHFLLFAKDCLIKDNNSNDWLQTQKNQRDSIQFTKTLTLLLQCYTL